MQIADSDSTNLRRKTESFLGGAGIVARVVERLEEEHIVVSSFAVNNQFFPAAPRHLEAEGRSRHGTLLGYRSLIFVVGHSFHSPFTLRAKIYARVFGVIAFKTYRIRAFVESRSAPGSVTGRAGGGVGSGGPTGIRTPAPATCSVAKRLEPSSACRTSYVCCTDAAKSVASRNRPPSPTCGAGGSGGRTGGKAAGTLTNTGVASSETDIAGPDTMGRPRVTGVPSMTRAENECGRRRGTKIRSRVVTATMSPPP